MVFVIKLSPVKEMLGIAVMTITKAIFFKIQLVSYLIRIMDMISKYYVLSSLKQLIVGLYLKALMCVYLKLCVGLWMGLKANIYGTMT